VGHEHRYLYIGAARSPQGNAPLQAVLKLDLQTGDRALFDLGARVFGGEPLFVPNPQATQEDDGWVLLLAYNAERHASDLIILAAQDLSLVARLKLKHHVPYGLHGSFVPQVFGIPA
jgi:all-trans-8'-apo-beta-carotenal 15,15'-oxygenase